LHANLLLTPAIELQWRTRSMGMTGDLEHPTYPNPTVVEALCHIDFEPSPEAAWQISRPTRFLQLVTDEYPNVYPVSIPNITMTPLGPGVQIVAALRLSNEEANRYMAIGDKHFVFGHQKGYPGWIGFRDKILDAWSKFISVARPRQITRIGLRYVNLIPRTPDHPLISDWLKPTATIPETFVRSKSDPFMFRTESWIKEGALLIVQIGLAASPSPSELSKIVFDIDRLTAVEADPDPANLMRELEVLHNDVWQEFATAKAPLLEAHLRSSAS
jgi:uncharacterized protein (TIGR04255 family)